MKHHTLVTFSKILTGDSKMTSEKTYKLANIYKEVNNAEVSLEVDGDDLIIRNPYIPGDAKDIITILNMIMIGKEIIINYYEVIKWKKKYMN